MTRSPRRLGGRLIPEFALALVSIGVALLLGEVAVRALGLGPTFHVVYNEIFQLSDNPVLAYELRPGAVFAADVINSSGFRDREFPRTKPADSFRVATVGDSVTFGMGVPNASSYPKQLERLLAAYAIPDAPRFEVLNFGIHGYNIEQVVGRVRTLALDFEPDLVIYGYVLNDPQEHSRVGLTLARLREREENRSLDPRRLNRALAHSRLFLLARQLIRSPETTAYTRHGSAQMADLERGEVFPFQHPPRDPAFAARARGDTRGRYLRSLHSLPEGRARFERGMEDLAQLSRDAEIPTAVAIFPIFFDPTEGPSPVRDVHALVAEQAHANGLEVIDLLAAFEAAARRFGPESCVEDFLHPNQLGHAVAAMALLRGLRTRGLLRADWIDARRLEAATGRDGELWSLLASASPRLSAR